MKAGDLVRFKPPYFINSADGVFGNTSSDDIRLLGLLIKYEPWHKMTSVMYEGQVLRIAARHVEKAGRKDGESR